MQISAIALIAVAWSCKKVTVADPTQTQTGVTFSTDWKDISSEAPIPPGSTVWLYPQNGGEPIVIEIATAQQVSRNIPLGVYNMIVVNNNLNTIKRRGEHSFDSHECYLELKEPNPEYNFDGFPKNAPAIPTVKDGIFTKQNTRTIVANADYLHVLKGITPKVVTVTEKPISVTLRPSTLTNVYNLNIAVESPDNISGGYAKLSGVATSVVLATTTLSSSSNSEIEFSLLPSTNGANTFVGQALALGLNPEKIGEVNSNKLQIVLKYEDPEKTPINQEIDLSKDIKDPNVNLDVDIKVDAIKGSPEITVTVKPWAHKDGEDIDVTPVK